MSLQGVSLPNIAQKKNKSKTQLKGRRCNMLTRKGPCRNYFGKCPHHGDELPTLQASAQQELAMQIAQDAMMTEPVVSEVDKIENEYELGMERIPRPEDLLAMPGFVPPGVRPVQQVWGSTGTLIQHRMHHSNARRRMSALEAWGEVGMEYLQECPEAQLHEAPQMLVANEVVERLGDADPKVRDAALGVLQSLPFVAPHAAQSDTHQEISSARKAASAVVANAVLTGNANPRIHEAVKVLDGEHDLTARIQAIKLIGAQEEASSCTNILLECLADVDNGVRRAALEVLGAHAQPWVEAPSTIVAELAPGEIVEALPHGWHKWTEGVIVRGLAQMQYVIDFDLGKGETAVATVATVPIRRIRKSAQQSALEPVQACLLEEDEAVRHAAASAINKIDQRGFRTEAMHTARAVLQWVCHDDERVRGCAVEAMALMPALGATVVAAELPYMSSLLVHPHPGIRWSALKVLGAVQGPALPPLLPLVSACLKDSNAGVRWGAVRAIGGAGQAAEGCLPELARLLRDKDWCVRSGAAEAIGEMWRWAMPYLPQLVECMEDSDWHVRESAVKALRAMGASGARLERLIKQRGSTQKVIRAARETSGSWDERMQHAAAERMRQFRDADS